MGKETVTYPTYTAPITDAESALYKPFLKELIDAAFGVIGRYFLRDIAIVDKANGTPVGSVYYRDVDHDFNSAEYGIFIGEESARGKGFGTETARLFTDFGFAALGLHRISLRVLAENTPARRSYAAAGFVEEGTFRDMVRLDGVYRDVVFMAKIAQ